MVMTEVFTPDSSVKTIDAGIIIPAYNEAARGLDFVLEDTLNALENKFGGGRYELIVANDGSTDSTVGIAAAHEVSVLNLPHQGKGAAVRAGILSSTATVRAFMDADGSFRPKDVIGLIEEVADGATDIAIASRGESSRSHNHGSLLRSVGHASLSKICEIIAPTGVSDTQCGAKAFKNTVVDELFPLSVVDGFAFDLEVLHLASKLGYSVAEYGLDITPKSGSKVRPIKDGAKMLSDARLIRRTHRNLVTT